MAGLATMALTVGSTHAAAGVYGLAALTLLLTLFTSALAVAYAQDQMKDRLQGIAPTIKTSGGVLLIVVGVYLISLSVFSSYFETVFPV